MPRKVSHRPSKIRKGGNVRWRVYFAAGEIAPSKKLKDFKTRTDALAFVEDAQRRLQRLGPLAAETTPTELVNARQASQILKDTGMTVTEAARLAVEKHSAEQRSQTLAYGFSRYLEDCTRRNTSPKHLRDLIQTLNLLKSLHEHLLVNLTPESIDSALHGIGPASRNLKIRHLKSVLNFCMKHDWLKDSPLRRVDLAPIQRREIQTYTPEQVRSIMLAVKQLYPEAVPFFAICFFAGTRPEEVLRLDWNAISDREHICVPAEVSKTRSRRFTTISPTLLAWLNWHEQNGGPTEGRIFPKSEMTLIRMRRNVAKSAQVKWIQDGARKTFASAHFKTFMDAGKTAYELGHRGTSMLHTHYNQNMRKEDAEQFWKIVPPL